MSSTALPANTHIGSFHLQVSSLERSLAFYQTLLGFRVIRQDANQASLSPTGEEPALIVLTAVPGLKPRPRNTTGLYHAAIRLPNRVELARVFQRLIVHEWRFQGFSDHAVSEALYLPDPDGNGLELYRDRPRDEWPHSNGQLAMTTEPLDVDDLLAQAGNTPWTGIHPQTDIGHMHLHVADLDQAEAFYCGLIGLDMMVSWKQHGALFVSAGGYHHHLGLNIWAGRGAPPAPADAVGLRSFMLRIPDADALQQARQRLESAGVTLESGSTPGSIRAHDPSGNVIELAG
ncbi:MAG: VOC family protein [Anaerolineae bacterium]|nr:VOC family protein [Anaerolineae bacterium]